ncbi:MAG TPA: hypothetical protein VHE35_19595 [Kofleriaceae bacterium]|nr:hypothetical protein [Kofleriaceae bacterium]
MTSTRFLSALALAALLVSGSGGCQHAAVRQATFRARPDGVAAGDLRGPFTGRVLDGTTRTPVAGAMVYASWSLVRGNGLTVDAGTREAVVSTDATGHYLVPELDAIPGGTRLADVRLVIYKRGYIGYRSDRRFDDFGPRRDFAQQDNIVHLERWRPEASHARHLRFLGGGGAIAAVTAWEAGDAISELEPGHAPSTELPSAGSGPYLVAAQLLTAADIAGRTHYDGQFETGPLGDEPDTSSYSSQHFKAMGRDEAWDVAVRMWRLDPAAALDRYDELRSGLPQVEERDEIASRSLRAVEADIFGVAFLDGQRGLVVLITCGKSQCASTDDAAALGQIIDQRIKALWPLGNGAPQPGGHP